jgi:signal transduction histidine kinase
MDELIGDLTEVMRSGSIVDETTDVELAAISREVWQRLQADADRLDVNEAKTIWADPQALMRLLENLFQNSLRHGGPDVTVRVGMLPEGFYVEDDGEGIPEEDRSEVFVPGYSTAEGDTGTGFGLVSVRQIAAGHGWDVGLADSEEGGLRVEFTDVETWR